MTDAKLLVERVHEKAQRIMDTEISAVGVHQHERYHKRHRNTTPGILKVREGEREREMALKSV